MYIEVFSVLVLYCVVAFIVLEDANQTPTPSKVEEVVDTSEARRSCEQCEPKANCSPEEDSHKVEPSRHAPHTWYLLDNGSFLSCLEEHKVA